MVYTTGIRKVFFPSPAPQSSCAFLFALSRNNSTIVLMEQNRSLEKNIYCTKETAWCCQKGWLRKIWNRHRASCVIWVAGKKILDRQGPCRLMDLKTERWNLVRVTLHFIYLFELTKHTFSSELCWDYFLVHCNYKYCNVLCYSLCLKPTGTDGT